MWCWRGYLSAVGCRFACGSVDATAIHYPCFSKIQIGFTFLESAHPGNTHTHTLTRVIPNKIHRAAKQLCVCVCVCVRRLM